MSPFTLGTSHKKTNIFTDNLTNQMRAFAPGEAHKPNIDFSQTI